MDTATKYSATELIHIFPEARAIVRHNLRRLLNEEKELAKQISMKIRIICEKTPKDSFDREFWLMVVEAFDYPNLEKIRQSIRKQKRYLQDLFPKSKKGITTDEIERAKDVPFESLLPFGRKRQIPCMFHEEKTPSLTLYKKKNCIKCFGCGVFMDTIEFIRQTQNLGFVEAVRQLNQ